MTKVIPKIEPYNPEQDKAMIMDMLREDDCFSEVFNKHENKHSEYIYTAHFNNHIAGVLSLDAIERGPYIMLYVNKQYREIGVGTALMQFSEQLFAEHDIVERVEGFCLDNECSLRFMYKNDYSINQSTYTMERISEFLPESDLTVRQYQDADYTAFHNTREMAFYLMRESIGITPSYHNAPSEGGFQRFHNERENIFVMLVENELIATGQISGNEIIAVAVRPDYQARGYGRAFVSFLVNEIMRRGEKSVKLVVTKGNYAKKLYESLGFKETSVVHWVRKYYRPDTRLSGPPFEGMSNQRGYDVFLKRLSSINK